MNAQSFITSPRAQKNYIMEILRSDNLVLYTDRLEIQRSWTKTDSYPIEFPAYKVIKEYTDEYQTYSIVKRLVETEDGERFSFTVRMELSERASKHLASSSHQKDSEGDGYSVYHAPSSLDGANFSNEFIKKIILMNKELICSVIFGGEDRFRGYFYKWL